MSGTSSFYDCYSKYIVGAFSENILLETQLIFLHNYNEFSIRF